MRAIVLVLALSACWTPPSVQPARCPGVQGPRLLPQRYTVRPDVLTASGVQVDTSGVNVDVGELDRRVRAVADCLGRTVDYTCIVVKIPADSVPSCSGPWRLLPIPGAPASCGAKGQTASAACPCLYRAGVQPDGAIVTEPTLSNLGTPLVTAMTGVEDPWRAGPKMERCALAGSRGP